MTKRIKKKPGDPTAAQKAAATRKRNKLKADKPTAVLISTEKPDVEKTDVKITPYPRTGDNPNFENVLDNVGSEDGRPLKTEPAAPAEPAAPTPAIPAEPMTVDDVAEWLDVPFSFWAEVNKLPGLALTPKEAKSIAEPLARILNRHKVSGLLHPDVFDGMKIAARLKPLMSERFVAIKIERGKRAAAGDPAEVLRPGPTRATPVQGAAATKPRTV